MSKRKLIGKHYEPRISPGRENYDVLDWASAKSQRNRFEVLAANVDLAGRSLLDVGCGLGDLLGFLQERGVSVDYTGVDLLEKMVARAGELHPGGRFICADIFAANPFGPEAFDVVFCSGVFNLSLGNNEEFLDAAVGRMLDIARRTLAFNLLHSRAERFDRRYYHYDPAAVKKLLAGKTASLRILDDYLHNDFTVICEK